MFFANSGSEAVEAALRLARQATGRPNIVVFHGGFHGRTMAAGSMTTSGTKFRAGFSPLMARRAVAPFPDADPLRLADEQATDFALAQLDYLLQTVSAPADTAAFFVEPVLGEGGYVPANARFLAGLRERADRHGILLVLDEVQTGLGRTGRFWGHDHFGVAPGHPGHREGAGHRVPAVRHRRVGGADGEGLAGLAGRHVRRQRGRLRRGDRHPRRDPATRAWSRTRPQRGAQLSRRCRRSRTSTPRIGDVRGLGLMLGNEFRDADGKPDPATAAAAQQEAARRGLLLLTCGAWGNVVRLIPALVVNPDQIDEAAGIWAEAVSAVRVALGLNVKAGRAFPWRSGRGGHSGRRRAGGGAFAVPGISLPLIGHRVVSGTVIRATAPTTQAAIM